MVDGLLDVLNLPNIGAVKHAEKIREVYEKKIGKHRRCGECRKGMRSQNLVRITKLYICLI